MTSTDWPLGAKRWLLNDQGYSPSDIERRMVTPAGTRVKRIGTTGPDVFSGTLLLDAPEFAYWVAWIRHTIEDGMQWVTVPTKASGRSLELEARIPISALRHARVNSRFWRASASWETLSGTEISYAEYAGLNLPPREWPWSNARWLIAGSSYAPTDVIDRFESSHGSAQWPVTRVAPDVFSASLLLPGHATDLSKNIFGQFVAWLRYGLRGRCFKCVIAANGTVEPRIIRFVGGSMQYRLVGVNHWSVQASFESRVSTELAETSFGVVDLYGTGTTTPFADWAQALSDSMNQDRV